MRIDDIVTSLVDRLKVIRGVKAVVLGGSRADDTHKPDSDFDVGIYYDDPLGLDLDGIKKLANAVNDTPDPTVTSLGGWGKWINGGAWLTVRGRRVDFLYRDINFVRQVIQDSKRGFTQFDFYQQPPYGFYSYIYCGEIQTCRVLFDPDASIARLKEDVTEYPEPLKKTIVDGNLWDAEFALSHCKKAAEHGEVLIVAGCLTRIASDLIQVLYAINEVFFVSEKKFLGHEATFRLKPDNLAGRIIGMLGEIGKSPEEMKRAVLGSERLVEDMRQLAGGLYQPKFKQ